MDTFGTLIGLHGRSRDVTDRLRLEVDLQQHRDNLECSCREHPDGLSVAKAARSAAKAENVFLSTSATNCVPR